MPYSSDHKTETKNRILQSATELFCRHGFEKVSIGQIMKLARMTHGAFYAHFESKEALFSASLLGTLRNSRVARLVKGPLSLKHLLTLVSGYLNLQETHGQSRPGSESILVNEIGNQNEEVRRLYDQAYERLKKILENRLMALSRLKKLPFQASQETVSDKARAIIASLIGALAVAKSISQEDEQRSILVAAQRHILEILGVDAKDLGVVLE